MWRGDATTNSKSTRAITTTTRTIAARTRIVTLAIKTNGDDATTHATDANYDATNDSVSARKEPNKAHLLLDWCLLWIFVVGYYF